MLNKTRKILVVEDDPDIGNMIRTILEYKCYTAFVLQNADQINEFIKSNGIDVVIMDMLLSGSNGTDICSRLKKDPSLAHIPLIMMSAHPDAERLCLQAGADDFVSKPFDLEELLSKISHFTQPASV